MHWEVSYEKCRIFVQAPICSTWRIYIKKKWYSAITVSLYPHVWQQYSIYNATISSFNCIHISNYKNSFYSTIPSRRFQCTHAKPFINMNNIGIILALPKTLSLQTCMHSIEIDIKTQPDINSCMYKKDYLTFVQISLCHAWGLRNIILSSFTIQRQQRT